MSTFQELSDALANAVEMADPSLVRVDGRRRLAASGIVWAEDGVIVTAHHVLNQDENITVGFADGTTAAATLVGRDPTTDLAVLRIEAKGLKPPTWAMPDDLRVGHLVLALGRPGQSVQATHGVISALGGEWRTAGGGVIQRYVQTDVLMYPGFSGGPLVTVSGHVAGLNSSSLARGVSVSVPATTVRRVVETLLTHGRVRKGYLGVGIQPVRLPGGLKETLDQETGLLVTSVEPESPADKGGLLLGDTIFGLEENRVGSPEELNALLGGDRVGKSVTIQIVRGGQVQKMDLVIGERSS